MSNNLMVVPVILRTMFGSNFSNTTIGQTNNGITLFGVTKRGRNQVNTRKYELRGKLD